MGAKKLKDLDTIMTVGILAKNVQTVDSEWCGVGFREPAEIPRIKERLMSAAVCKVECTACTVQCRCWTDGDV